MIAFLRFVVASCCMLAVLGSVIVLRSTNGLYDRAPKLLIRGAGFPTDPNDIFLEISISGSPSLVRNVDYTLTTSEDGLILDLQSDARCVVHYYFVVL